MDLGRMPLIDLFSLAAEDWNLMHRFLLGCSLLVMPWNIMITWLAENGSGEDAIN